MEKKNEGKDAGSTRPLTKKGRRRNDVGYLFNYHLGTAAYVGAGNSISRLPPILGF